MQSIPAESGKTVKRLKSVRRSTSFAAIRASHRSAGADVGERAWSSGLHCRSRVFGQTLGASTLPSVAPAAAPAAPAPAPAGRRSWRCWRSPLPIPSASISSSPALPRMLFQHGKHRWRCWHCCPRRCCVHRQRVWDLASAPVHEQRDGSRQPKSFVSFAFPAWWTWVHATQPWPDVLEQGDGSRPSASWKLSSAVLCSLML